LELQHNNSIQNLYNTPKPNIYITNKKIFYINELFDITKKPKEIYTGNTIVNVIAAKNNNNGVKGLSLSKEKETFTGNKIVLVTGGDGGAGCAFYQEKEFMITSATIVLIPKNIVLDKYIGIYCANELSKYKTIYSRGFQWKLERINKDTIELPVTINNEIDYLFITTLF
jgi:hypothetical protein